MGDQEPRRRPDEVTELPLLNLSANPETPHWWWDGFVREYGLQNEHYPSRAKCCSIVRENPNPTATRQWNAWLWYVANRRLTGEN